jgi:hypothetical protein
MARDGYKTAQEIADELGVSISKLRTIIARLNIQPTRFPGDLRKLYYSSQQIKEIRRELDLSSDSLDS